MTLPFKLPLRVEQVTTIADDGWPDTEFRIWDAAGEYVAVSESGHHADALVRIVNEAVAFQESVSLLLEHAVSTGEARTTLSLGARSEKPWYAMSDEQRALCKRLSELLPVPATPVDSRC